MLTSQVIELNPTPAQQEIFVRHAAAARIARNDHIALWRTEGRRLRGFRYTREERRRVLNSRKFSDHPWFAELSQNAVKGGYIDAQDAIERYEKKQNKPPRFHGKSKRLAFRADNGAGTVRVEGKAVILPKKAGGRVKSKEELRWPGREIRECRIKEKGGQWYAAVRVEIDAAEYGQKCGSGTVGIDLGLKTFATIAWPDGSIEKVEAPEPLRRSLRALRLQQRRLSRRKKGGRNRQKTRTAVAKRHRRMSNIRKDFLHKLSHRVTAGAETVQVENLSIKGWQKLWGRKVNDLAPGEFLRQLAYKAEWRSGQFVAADWRFPSSQICHACGERHGRLGLDIRQWTCPACGSVRDRDGNAALNIRDYGPELPGVWPRRPCETGTEPAVAVEVATGCPSAWIKQIGLDSG